jgi:hypothetical protein
MIFFFLQYVGSAVILVGNKTDLLDHAGVENEVKVIGVNGVKDKMKQTMQAQLSKDWQDAATEIEDLA